MTILSFCFDIINCVNDDFESLIGSRFINLLIFIRSKCMFFCVCTIMRYKVKQLKATI